MIMLLELDEIDLAYGGVTWDLGLTPLDPDSGTITFESWERDEFDDYR